MSAPKPFDESEWHELIRRREIHRCASTLSQLGRKLQFGEDYTTRTPELLAKLISQIASILAEKILTDVPTSDLEQVNTFVGIITLHLRYVERARVTVTPWSIVQVAENLFRKVAGQDSHFIIRPNWAYNYSLIGDFWKFYRDSLSCWPWFPLSQLKEHLKFDDQKTIYCISFPRIERNNCLLHANWGHEVGHILAARWVDSEFNTAWSAAEPDIQNRIEEVIRKIPPPVEPLLKDLMIKDIVAKRTQTTMSVARRGFIELLCDLVGAHLFGPSVLASSMEYSALFTMDVSPLESEYYPPWRYRIRKIVEFCKPDLDGHAGTGYPSDAMLPFIEWLKVGEQLASVKKDEAILESNIVTAEAYKFIQSNWDDAAKKIISMLQGELTNPYRLHQRHVIVDKLIGRLKDGIPPNEADILSDQPALLQDILCAAWAHKIYGITQDSNWGTNNEYDLLYRLVLKACESSFIHADWIKRLSTEHL